jgi:hypothetical protein
VDGELLGGWERRQRRVTIRPWRNLPKKHRGAAEEEALRFPIASGSKAEVHWH